MYIIYGNDFSLLVQCTPLVAHLQGIQLPKMVELHGVNDTADSETLSLWSQPWGTAKSRENPHGFSEALSMNYEFVLCAAAESFLPGVFGIICIFFCEVCYASLPPWAASPPLKFVVRFILRRDKNYVQNVLSHVWL